MLSRPGWGLASALPTTTHLSNQRLLERILAMAKMFYTIEEVAQKLGKSEEDVKEMARTGQIQEFRDRDKLMFKVDQIDLLASSDEVAPTDLPLDLEDSAASGLGLADSAASGLGLQDSGTGGSLSLEESREGTGISVFDTDHGLEGSADATSVGDTIEADDELSLESVGSGSGLLDLTRESDDTSLGAELLEEVYAGDADIELPGNASGLFEATAEPVPAEASMPAGGLASMPVMVDTYDGAGSGLATGLLIGAMAAMVCVAIIAIVGLSGATPGLATMMSGNIMVYGGGLLGITLVLGIVGLFIGKATE